MPPSAVKTAPPLPYEEVIRLSRVIDFYNMLKISNAIAAKIKLDSLINKLLNAIAHHIAADRIFLLLKRRLPLYPGRISRYADDQVITLQNEPFNHPSRHYPSIPFMQLAENERKTINFTGEAAKYPQPLAEKLLGKSHQIRSHSSRFLSKENHRPFVYRASFLKLGLRR